jgi:PAS domain S-box-containing protein
MGILTTGLRGTRTTLANAITHDDELLRAIVETTPECIKIVRADGILLHMNSAGRDMVEADDAIRLEGANIFDIIAPEHIGIWKTYHERVCSGEKLNWEFDIIGLRGTRRHMETHAVPLRMPDGNFSQLAITRDITRRKQDDHKLRESEHRYKQLLQALPAAVYTTDQEGNITFYNEAAAEFAGRRPALGDKWCVTWQLLNPDGTPLPHDQCPMAVTLREQQPVRGAEAIAVRPDGSRIWFEPYPAPLTDASGAMVGAINMLVDISERKVAEQQKLLIDELNHRVKNTLATIQSLITQTSGNSIEEYQKVLRQRVLAMSRAHDQLSSRNWQDAELSALATAGLAPYLNKGNVIVSGIPTIVPPRAALMLSMAIHELATNAAKYGALSVADGKVDLSWNVQLNGHGALLRIHWNEIGGPVVLPPARRGFGTLLVEQGVPMELRGTSKIDFSPSGIRCEIEVPLDNVV